MTSDPIGVTVDVIRAESSRFRNPLLMLHGLWTGAWIWRDFAAYLAHRGWDALAPSFLSDVVANDASQRLRVLEEIARTLPAPPIVVTHDTGVVTGLAFAAAIGAPAIVAIAPVGIPTEPSPTGIFAHPQFLWARMFGSGVQPPRGRAARLLLHGLGEEQNRLLPDSGPFLRAVLSRRARVHDPPPRPGLLVWSREDLIMPVSSAERTAERLGWSFDVHESAGHFPMLAGGCERLADRVHRWIVKAVGADLLAWLDDDDVPE